MRYLGLIYIALLFLAPSCEDYKLSDAQVDELRCELEKRGVILPQAIVGGGGIIAVDSDPNGITALQVQDWTQGQAIWAYDPTNDIVYKYDDGNAALSKWEVVDLSTIAAAEGTSLNGTTVELGHAASGTGASDFTANRYLYTGNFDLEIGGVGGSGATANFYLDAGGDLLLGSNSTTNMNNLIGAFYDNGKGALIGGLHSTAILDGIATTSLTWGNTLTNTSAFTAVFGRTNTVTTGDYSLVGGRGNSVVDVYSVVGGQNNTTLDSYQAIFGLANDGGGRYSIVAGQAHTPTVAAAYNAIFGRTNTSTAAYNIIAGQNNSATDSHAAIFGLGNTGARYSLIGGNGNTATNQYAFIAGLNNTVSGSAGVALNRGTTASGTASFAAGEGNTGTIEAAGAGSFVHGYLDVAGTITATATNSVIFGHRVDGVTTSTVNSVNAGLYSGRRNSLNLAALQFNSVILGGEDIVPTIAKSGMAYVGNLSIWDTPTNTTTAGSYAVLYRDAADEGEVKTATLDLTTLYSGDGSFTGLRTVTSTTAATGISFDLGDAASTFGITTGDFSFDGDLFAVQADGGVLIDFDDAGTGADFALIENGAAINTLTADNNNIGININDPVSNLHVNGPTNTETYFRGTNSFTGATTGDGFSITSGNGTVNITNHEAADMNFEVNSLDALQLEANDQSIRGPIYGDGDAEAGDLGRTESGYIASWATDGTILDLDPRVSETASLTVDVAGVVNIDAVASGTTSATRARTIELTGATAARDIDGITYSAANHPDGFRITFINVSANDYTFSDLTNGTANDFSMPGNNADVTVPPAGSITVQRNDTLGKWIVIASQT